MKEREPAIKLDIPLMEEVTWFRQYLVKENDKQRSVKLQLENIT